MNMEKTPVLLLTYNRDEELRNALANLASSIDSDRYDLFIHIDAPNIFRDEDDGCHKRIQNCIKEYSDKFRRVNVLEEEYHCGLANSVISSVSEVINKYGKIIVIEDDLFLSKDCLNFLNDALTYYENDKSIWSVTGYTPPLESKNNLASDVYFSYRSSSWAWATWKDRWDDIDWEVSDFDEFINDVSLQEDFCRGGYDLPQMLTRQMYGLIDSWAVRWCYSQTKKNMLSVFPKNSRAMHVFSEKSTHVMEVVKNEAFSDDGTGYSFVEPYIDDEVTKEFAQSFSITRSQWEKWSNNDNSNWYRFEGMFEAMNLWKKISASGHNISEYFINRGYKKIGIYGKGKIGGHLQRELAGTDVEVSFFIDRDESKRDKLNCFLLDDKLPNCDVIVITVAGYIKPIIKQLFVANSCDIKSILDVLNDR